MVAAKKLKKVEAEKQKAKASPPTTPFTARFKNDALDHLHALSLKFPETKGPAKILEKLVEELIAANPLTEEEIERGRCARLNLPIPKATATLVIPRAPRPLAATEEKGNAETEGLDDRVGLHSPTPHRSPDRSVVNSDDLSGEVRNEPKRPSGFRIPQTRLV